MNKLFASLILVLVSLSQYSYAYGQNSYDNNIEIVKPMKPNNPFDAKQFFGYYSPLYDENIADGNIRNYYPTQTIIINGDGFFRRRHHKKPLKNELLPPINQQQWKKLYD